MTELGKETLLESSAYSSGILLTILLWAQSSNARISSPQISANLGLRNPEWEQTEKQWVVWFIPIPKFMCVAPRLDEWIKRDPVPQVGQSYCPITPYISKCSRWFHSVVHGSQQTPSYWCKSGRERAIGHYFLTSPYLITQESMSALGVRKASHDFWSLHSKHAPNKAYPIQTHFKGKV